MGRYLYLVFGPTLFGKRSSINVSKPKSSATPKNHRRKRSMSFWNDPNWKSLDVCGESPRGWRWKLWIKNETGKTRDESVGMEGWWWWWWGGGGGGRGRGRGRGWGWGRGGQLPSFFLELTNNSALCHASSLKPQAGHLTMPIQRTNSQRRYASRSHFPIHMSWAPKTARFLFIFLSSTLTSLCNKNRKRPDQTK